MRRLLGVSVEIERRRLLALIASRFAGAPKTAPATGLREVFLCDESIAIIKQLIAAGYHRTPEEVVQAAMEALMAHHDPAG
jgi:hypothetical protein